MTQRDPVPYGAKKAGAMREMSQSARLDFIAEGLTIILSSARSFWSAAEKLPDNPREASVLEGFAEEESAKALILLDLVRCPPSKIDGRIGRIVKNFYSHLARLIYAKAQSWRPVNVKQLQEYVDSERQGHYLEGGMSEYILPNWAIYSRESTLYADIEQHEDGIPQWSDPTRFSSVGIHMRPFAPTLIEALDALGIFSRAGLEATSDIWGTVDFLANEHSGHVRDLTGQLAKRLDAEGLVTETAANHARWFHHYWQMPMYNLDFTLIPASLDRLRADREAAYWSEVGYEHHGDY
ncbi:hypothetical protein [Sphingomonas sp.]|uniref:hypothetical protein n=1 Tax=Sphingomonas sp. TaxID=28214 RepID=UPI0028A94E2E|nr:hypothetical protein [Sphingomonas sp.]